MPIQFEQDLNPAQLEAVHFIQDPGKINAFILTNYNMELC